ncbi:MAG: hypothetical protein AB1405_01985 [Bdellovibrionota bacterium]
MKLPPTYAVLDFEIRKGDDFELFTEFFQDEEVTPLNLTGYTIRAKVREKEDSTSTVLLECTTANNRMVITDAANGQAKLFKLTDAETSAFTWTKGYYDLELESPAGEARCYFKGKITLTPEITTS